MTSVFQVNSGHHHPGLPEEWTKVFVGGLCQKTTDRKLREHFVKFGPLHSCLVVKNKSTGAGRGFGFVVYRRPESAQKAVQESKQHVDGKEVDVKYAFVGAKVRAGTKPRPPWIGYHAQMHMSSKSLLPSPPPSCMIRNNGAGLLGPRPDVAETIGTPLFKHRNPFLPRDGMRMKHFNTGGNGLLPLPIVQVLHPYPPVFELNLLTRQLGLALPNPAFFFP